MDHTTNGARRQTTSGTAYSRPMVSESWKGFPIPNAFRTCLQLSNSSSSCWRLDIGKKEWPLIGPPRPDLSHLYFPLLPFLSSTAFCAESDTLLSFNKGVAFCTESGRGEKGE